MEVTGTLSFEELDMEVVMSLVGTPEPEHHFHSRSFSTEQAAKNPQRCIDRIAGFVKEKIQAFGHDPNDYDFQLSRKVSLELGTYRIQCEYWKARCFE